MGCCKCCRKKNKNHDDIESFLNSTDSTAEHPQISKDDFLKVKIIGRGSFGKVILVRKKSDNKLYAMKVLKKYYIKEKNQVEHTRTERKLLEKINYPFIVQLYYAFQDKDKLYLVTEFMQGGELFYHIQREQFFEDERAQFYAAEIVLALTCLHRNNYIYRDLKPENVLLDKYGHLKLADFGLSKVCFEKDRGRAYTICGTPQYLAPEMLEGKGYDKTVDWWSLGILIYEMLSGKFPFDVPKGSELDREYFTVPLELPNNFTDSAKKIVQDFLTVNPKKRLGYGKNELKDIKAHPYFKNINWKLLEERKVDPPFVPVLKDEEDVSYFDKVFTNENLNDSNIEMIYKPKKNEFKGFTYEDKLLGKNDNPILDNETDL